MNHVAVREDEAVFGHDEARPVPPPGTTSGARVSRDFDLDHRRAHVLRDARHREASTRREVRRHRDHERVPRFSSATRPAARGSLPSRYGEFALRAAFRFAPRREARGAPPENRRLRPSTREERRPRKRPAFSAGLPPCTESTSSPVRCDLDRVREPDGYVVIPRNPRRTWPCWKRLSTTGRRVSTGNASGVRRRSPAVCEGECPSVRGEEQTSGEAREKTRVRLDVAMMRPPWSVVHSPRRARGRQRNPASRGRRGHQDQNLTGSSFAVSPHEGIAKLAFVARRRATPVDGSRPAISAANDSPPPVRISIPSSSSTV